MKLLNVNFCVCMCVILVELPIYVSTYVSIYISERILPFISYILMMWTEDLDVVINSYINNAWRQVSRNLHSISVLDLMNIPLNTINFNFLMYKDSFFPFLPFYS